MKITFHGKTDKNETVLHYTVKSLTHYVLRSMKHKADMEVDFVDSIADVFDSTTGIAYEPQGNCRKAIVDHKVKKLMLHSEVKDVKIIPLSLFSMDMTIKEIMKILKDKIVV